MSAFVVGDLTITRSVLGILGAFDKYPTTPEVAEDLGRKLRQMNIDAMIARYENRLDADELNPAYSFPGFTEHGDSPLVIYTALKCLRYQCAEGDVPETNPLWAELETAAVALERLHNLTPGRYSEQSDAWGG